MNRPKNEQMKPIIMAIGAATAAAIAAMMVPVSVIESITGATGISELIPATGAPLGAKARAIISFFAGVITMMMAMGYLMRRNSETQTDVTSMQNTARTIDMQSDSSSLFTKLQSRLSSIKTSGIQLVSIPWAKKDKDGIFDLADLPNLRVQDAHPDAPSRRPISALTDLADAELTPRAAPLPSPSLAVKEPIAIASDDETVVEQASLRSEWQTHQIAEATAEAAVPDQEKTQPEAVYAPPAKSEKPPLADLIAQLQAAIEGRLALLSKIEDLSAEVHAEKAATPAAVKEASAQDVVSSEPELLPPPVYSRPPLEAVPTQPRSAEDEEIDAALNAALETLQRMNVQAR